MKNECNHSWFQIQTFTFRSKETKKEKFALVEIKSICRDKNRLAYESCEILEQSLQLQTALQCSQINTGFLIFIAGSTENPLVCRHVNYKAFEIKNKAFFYLYEQRILNGFSIFISSCANYPEEDFEELRHYSMNKFHELKKKLIDHDQKQNKCKDLPNFEIVEPPDFLAK